MEESLKDKLVAMFPLKMEDIRREAMAAALSFCNGNRTHAAKILGIGVRTLQRAIRQYGL